VQILGMPRGKHSEAYVMRERTYVMIKFHLIYDGDESDLGGKGEIPDYIRNFEVVILVVARSEKDRQCNPSVGQKAKYGYQH
jgi:hypothetical protein